MSAAEQIAGYFIDALLHQHHCVPKKLLLTYDADAKWQDEIMALWNYQALPGKGDKFCTRVVRAH